MTVEYQREAGTWPVPTPAWHKDKVEQDDISFTWTSGWVDRVTRCRGRERDTRTLMVEVQTLPQQRRQELSNL